MERFQVHPDGKCQLIEHRHSHSATKPAAIAGLVAIALSLLVPLVFGMLRPEYSHVPNYISELGQTGSPYAGWVIWAGFLPIGLMVFLFLFLASSWLPVDRKSIFLFFWREMRLRDLGVFSL